MAEHDRGAHVSRVEDVFDGKDVWLVTANQLQNSVVDLRQPLGQRITRFRADHAALDQSERIAPFLPNYAVARDSGPGIDAKYDDRCGITHRTFALRPCRNSRRPSAR